jgi:hypothetical protein
MNKLVVFVLIITLVACERKPFVNHKIKLDKVMDNCGEVQDYFRIDANIAGERYEFETCLPADYDKDLLTSARKGDTVIVDFHKPAASKTDATYKVTLDIDSYPTYSFLTIEGQTYKMSLPEK